MKTNIKNSVKLLLALSMLWLFGCASIVRSPSVQSVKKIALVSVYIETPPFQGKTGILGFKETIDNLEAGEDVNEVALIEILQNATTNYEKALSSVEGWDVVPTQQIVQNERYQQTLEPMQFEGATTGVGKFFQQIGNSVSNMAAKGALFTFKPYEEMFFLSTTRVDEEKLAKLARELDVDAVGVIKLQLSHSRPWWSFEFLGLSRVYPKTNQVMVLVDRNAEILVDTRVNNTPWQKASKSVKMQVHDGEDTGYTFVDGSGQIKTYVTETYEKSALNLKTELTDAINKR